MNNLEELKKKLIEYGIEEYKILYAEKLEQKLHDIDDLSELTTLGAYSVFISFVNSKTGYDCDDVAIELSCLRENNRVDCFDDIALTDELVIHGFYIVENKVVIEIKDSEEEENTIYFWIDNKWN